MFTKAPFGIFFTPTFVLPAKKWDCWNLCWISTFCLDLDFLIYVSYTHKNTWRVNSPLIFYHYQDICLHFIYLHNLGPQVLPAITGLYLYFCFPSPTELLKILLGLLPLSICPQPLTAPSLRTGTCPKSNATLLSPHYSLCTLLSELFISKILGQVVLGVWEALQHLQTGWIWVNVCIHCIHFLIVLRGSILSYRFFHFSQKLGAFKLLVGVTYNTNRKKERERERMDGFP